MDLKLGGKTALVTGGSKGIGRAAAEILAGEGCNVIIVSRSGDALAAAKSAIVQKSNVRVDTVAADLSDSARVNELARDYPDIDILVNNAGAIPGGSLLNVDEATWRKAWDLKVFGYVNMCRAFYALMLKRKRGVIINVVGNAADTHDPEYICGVAGNAALAAFTQSLGSVSARDGIRVVAINPGPCHLAAVPAPRRLAPRSRLLLPTIRATPADPSSRSTPVFPRAPKPSER
jgi:hypothetical protein